MKLHPVVGLLLLSLISVPMVADCGCADTAPCEELSLQTVAARDPESAGFGAEVAPVAVRRASTGMAIEINSASSHSDAAFGVLILLCAPFVPIISALRRLLSSTGPLIELRLGREGSSGIDAPTTESRNLVRRISWEDEPRDQRLLPVPVRTR